MESVFFDSDEDLQKYIKSEDYGKMYKNGTRKKICLGVTFTQYDEMNV